MIFNIIAGMLTGFIVSIPPFGPITFAVISKGFKNEEKDGRAISLGAASMDFLYCLLAFGGISLLISLFPSAISKLYTEYSDLIEIILSFTGCVVVFLYGFKLMRTKITYDKLEEKKSSVYKSVLTKSINLSEKAKTVANRLKVKEIKNSNIFGLFIMGVLLCLSSLTIPASWFALIGYLKGFNFLNNSFIGGLLFSIGAFTGTFGWFYILLKLITTHKKRFNQKTLSKLNVIAGVILLILGVFLFIKALISVFHAA